MAAHSVCLLTVLAVLSLAPAYGQDYSSLLYTNLQISACTRLFNATSAIGCFSPKEGTAAPLAKLTTTADLSELLALPDPTPKMLLFSASMFSTTNVKKLNSAGLLGGILLLNGTIPAEFSPATQTPENVGSYIWNPIGDGLSVTSLPVPGALINSPSQAQELLALAAKNKAAGFNSANPYVVEMNIYMGPRKMDTPTCLKMGRCIPIGGQSVWATTRPLSAAVPSAPADVVMLTAAMDSTAFFRTNATSGADAASSIAAVLAVADALSRVNMTSLPRTVAYALFQSEAWGSLGSRKLVHDIRNFRCQQPIAAAASYNGLPMCASPVATSLQFQRLNISRLSHVIAVDQIGVAPAASASSPPPLFAHYASSPSSDAAAAALSATLTAAAAAATAGSGASTVATATASSMPPTPLTTFLTQGTAGYVPPSSDPSPPTTDAAFGWRAQGVVLAGYNSRYSDTLYRSHLDSIGNVDTAQITRRSTLIARTLYALASTTNDTAPPPSLNSSTALAIAANASLVQEIMDCLLVEFSCDFVSRYVNLSKATLTALRGGTGPATLYSGPLNAFNLPMYLGGNAFSPTHPSPLELALRNFLALAASPTPGSSFLQTPPPSASAPPSSPPRCSSLAECQDPSGSGAHNPATSTLSCLLGRCVIMTAHLHIARSPSLTQPQPLKSPNTYVADAAARAAITAGAANAPPLWSEPFWGSLTARSYRQHSPLADWLLLAVALLSLAAFCALTRAAVARVNRHRKVL